MSAQLHPSQDPDVRKSGIGGSDIPALAGFGYAGRNALTVWLEKTGRKAPDELGEAAHWGNILEEPVAQEAARRMGVRIARVNQTRRHPDLPYLMAHFDRRIIGRPRWMLEVKTTNVFQARGEVWLDADNLPPYVQLQCETYCEVGDLDGIVIAALIGGQELRLVEYHRDRVAGANILTIAERFYRNHIVTDLPPTPVTVEEARLLFPQHIEKAIEASNDIAVAYSSYRELKKMESSLKAQSPLLQGQIGGFLGEHDTLMIGGEPVLTWRTQTSRRFNEQLFKTDHPELHAQYVRPSSTRVMRLKGER